MKLHRSHFTLYILHFTLIFAAAFSSAAKTFDWRASPEPSAATFAAYHGETIEFRPVASNVVFSSVYYQTNGMGQAWWQTDGLTFHPTNDIGAAAYRFFVDGRDATGRDWRANGLLRMLDSPGFEPNTLAPPVVTLDFATVDVLNAPYYTKSEVDDLVGQGSVPGDYATVSSRAMSAVQPADLNDATNATLAVARSYTDTVAADKLDKSGGTITGYLTATVFSTPDVTIGVSGRIWQNTAGGLIDGSVVPNYRETLAAIAAATNATLAAAKDYTDAHAGPADALTLTSPGGIVWTVGVNNDGTIYTYIEE